MKHKKFETVRKLVEMDLKPLLVGEKATGKTTIAMQVAEALNLEFYSVSMTRQTTLSFLLGFINVNGIYVPSPIYEAATKGGLVLLDEIDAADPNVLLCLNPIENGYLAFPTGVVKLHSEFRLMATANPFDKHQGYTGRAILDAATLDRFDKITVDRDDDVEQSLVDADTFKRMNLLRQITESYNSSMVVSMRDSIRYQKRKEADLLDGFIEDLIGDNPSILHQYNSDVKVLPTHTTFEECNTFSEVVELIKANQHEQST